MLTKNLEDPSVLKLRQLIASRFGKGLEIRQLTELTDDGDEDILFLKGLDLHIPIRAEGNFLGTAVIPYANDMEESKKTDLAQVVRMVLKPTLYNQYLERKESNLIQLAEAQFPTDNLELLGLDLPFLDELLDEEFESEDEDLELNTQNSKQLISNLIHLDGKNAVMIKKAALQLHEMTHRWAFVPFMDIRDQLKSALDISKMGAMTIFADEIQDLSEEDQALLLEYVGSPRSDQEPLIITSSKTAVDELRSSSLRSELVDELQTNSFEVDRAPLGHKNLKEVLELFFLSGKDPK